MTLLRRTAVGVAGGVPVLVGLVLVPLPGGPGRVVVFSGVTVLGSEFHGVEPLARRPQAALGRGARWARSAAPPVRAALGVGLAASLVAPALLLLA